MKALIIILLLLSCTHKKKTSKSSQSLQNEAHLGKRIAVRILEKHPRIDDVKIQTYISSLGRSIAHRYGRQKIYHYFAVLNSPEPIALAVPGGFIFVTDALLREMTSEDQLVGVLIREVSSVNRMFVYKKYNKEKDIGKIVKSIFSQQYSKKEVRSVEADTLLGLMGLNYNPLEYKPFSKDPAYFQALLKKVKLSPNSRKQDRFKTMKSRL